MKYYQAKRDSYDYFNKQALISDEIITPHERDTKYRYITDDAFRKVEVSQRQTYTLFGVRRICDGAEVTEWKYTKDEAERAIYEKILEIKQIAMEYCPEDGYLTMCILENGTILFNNEYWNDNVKHKLEFHKWPEEED